MASWINIEGRSTCPTGRAASALRYKRRGTSKEASMSSTRQRMNFAIARFDWVAARQGWSSGHILSAHQNSSTEHSRSHFPPCFRYHERALCPWFVAFSSSPLHSVVDYGHTLINEDRVDTSRLLTEWGPRAFDADESLFSHFCRSTVAKVDEHGDTPSPSFGKRVNAAVV